MNYQNYKYKSLLISFKNKNRGILSKSTAFKIHPIFFMFSLFINLFYICFASLKFIFNLFFTITVTPNPYRRLVSCSRIKLGGF